MTPAEAFDAVVVMSARVGELVETLKRIESQNKAIITVLNAQAASNRQRSAAYSKLRKQYSELQATMTVKTEVAHLLKSILRPEDDLTDANHEAAVKRDFRHQKQHQTRKSTK